jgi:hypothetical protein
VKQQELPDWVRLLAFFAVAATLNWTVRFARPDLPPVAVFVGSCVCAALLALLFWVRLKRYRRGAPRE